jgi:hypothetical protein
MRVSLGAAKAICVCALASTWSVACGQLSNDDLVFLNGVPKSQEVNVDVQGTSSNTSALTADGAVGDTATYYGDLANQANQGNVNVDNILTFIDSIGHGYEPTKRSADGRVWGPIHDVDGQHYTLRFEVRRDNGVFTYCLWMGQDTEVTGEPTCDDVPAFDTIDQQPVDGMIAVLWGTYTPSLDASGALNSSGELTLALESAYENGLSADRGTLGVRHAYADAGAQKSIDVIADTPVIGVTPALHAELTYSHDVDGRVLFGLDTPANVITTTAALEQVSIRACWRDGGGGRADVDVSGGDLKGLREATSEECWDAGELRTYYIFTVPDYPVLTSTQGDPATCPPVDCE